MQFKVPQFIEQESKIVGPLTVKQAIILGLSGAITFVIYFSFGKDNMFIFLILAGIIMGAAITMAFLKIDGRPFTEMIGHFSNFLISPRLFLWKRKENPVFVKIELITPVEQEEQEKKAPAPILKSRGNLSKINKKINFS